MRSSNIPYRLVLGALLLLALLTLAPLQVASPRPKASVKVVPNPVEIYKPISVSGCGYDPSTYATINIRWPSGAVEFFNVGVTSDGCVAFASAYDTTVVGQYAVTVYQANTRSRWGGTQPHLVADTVYTVYQ